MEQGREDAASRLHPYPRAYIMLTLYLYLYTTCFYILLRLNINL